jgi:hypothetical protein
VQQHGEELRVREFAVNGLLVALLKGIEHAGQAQLLEGCVQFRTGIQGRLVDQQGLENATEAAAVDVGIGKRLRGVRDGRKDQVKILTTRRVLKRSRRCALVGTGNTSTGRPKSPVE